MTPAYTKNVLLEIMGKAKKNGSNTGICFGGTHFEGVVAPVFERRLQRLQSVSACRRLKARLPRAAFSGPAFTQP
jgi:hypothetical protein